MMLCIVVPNLTLDAEWESCLLQMQALGERTNSMRELFDNWQQCLSSCMPELAPGQIMGEFMWRLLLVRTLLKQVIILLMAGCGCGLSLGSPALDSMS